MTNPFVSDPSLPGVGARPEEIAGAPPPGGGRGTAGDAAAMVAERVVSQVAQFLIFVIAARILGPTEFGVFALASACAILLFRVAEMGWSPFILSRDDEWLVVQQVLFVAIMAGIGIGAAGVCAAWVAGLAGLSDDLVSLMILFAIWVALANAAVAQKGILTWAGRIRSAVVSEIAGEVVGLVVAIAALMQGAGVFALVYGRLTCQLTVLAVTFAATRRAPRRGLPRPVMQELVVFTAQIFSSRMLIHMRLHFITLIVGAFLGPTMVGFFRAADRVVGAVTELICVPGQMIAWQHLRRARNAGAPETRNARISETLAQHHSVLVALGAPLFLWLVVFDQEIVRGLFGEGWGPAATLMAILALGRLFMFPSIYIEPLLSIAGEARRLPGFTLAIFLVSVALILVFAPMGAVPLAWSQAGISVFGAIWTLKVFRYRAGISLLELGLKLRGILLALACGTMALMVFDQATRSVPIHDLVKAASCGLASGGFYVCLLLLFDPSFRTLIAKTPKLASNTGKMAS